MEEGFAAFKNVVRELPFFETVIRPFFRRLMAIITRPVMFLTDRFDWSKYWGNVEPETIQSTLQNYLKGLLLLLASSRVLEEPVFGWVGFVHNDGEIAWLQFAMRLMLASTVLEAMPVRPVFRKPQLPCVADIKAWGSVRDAWPVCEPWLSYLLRTNIAKCAVALVILTLLAPGAIGWLCLFSAAGVYLYFGICSLDADATVGSKLADDNAEEQLTTDEAGTLLSEFATASQAFPLHPQPNMSTLFRKQYQLSISTRMIARGFSDALLAHSPQGGTGKTYTITQTLRDEGVVPVRVNSHVTALELYRLFYEHREDRVIFMDDVDGILTSMPHLGILRSALFGEPRLVTYLSSKRPADLPVEFEFRSRVIICVNKLPANNPAFDAVLSRCDSIDMSATDTEIFEVMQDVAGQEFGDVDETVRAEILDSIQSTSGEHGLSLRALRRTMNKVRFALSEGIDWRELAPGVDTDE